MIVAILITTDLSDSNNSAISLRDNVSNSDNDNDKGSSNNRERESEWRLTDKTRRER